MTTTAAPVAPASATDVSDELVRGTRDRQRLRHLGAPTASILSVWGCLVAIAVAATFLLPWGPSFNLWRFATFVAVYAVVSQVEFEVGTGSAVPTQLVFIPMLFALHLGAVPAAVAAGLVIATVRQRPWPLREVSRVLTVLANAAYAFGPVLVVGLLHGLPLRWGAWPVYVVALASQVAFDFANTAITGRGLGIRVRTLVRVVGVVYLVDASLAPVGLLVAFAAQRHYPLVLLVLPLAALLQTFARERKQRIDHALELSDAYRGTAFLLGDVVEADDAYTGSHSRHVVDLVLAVCDELGISPTDRRDAEFVALLHDVGKIRIPSEIINKPGKLDAAERAIIETHTVIGEEMLERVGGLLGHVGRLVRSCHERYDGAGYPDGLAGESIPLVARIVCACDAFSAMTTDRSYRKARAPEEALEEMVRCAGSHFDPDVVAALVRVTEPRLASDTASPLG